ncbi:oxidoreductase [Asaia krungthepensis NRIC 0535]|uniref:Oxidoreductase n=2 Tax=Asaia krungthepensis TaxID=220990 RepID=A0ABQ0PWY6_9PROT|nr:oxidoreductase [Asaia krungthepensis NRIC 0535]
MQVAMAPYLEVEAAMLGQSREHVIEEPNATVEFGAAAAIKIDENGDIGLTGLAVKAGLSGVCHEREHKLFGAITRWPLGERSEACHLSAMSSSPASSPALDVLLSRASTDHLSAPAPDKEQIGRILSAGLRAPDHGKIRPWRYIVIKGKHRTEFAEEVVRAMVSADPEVPEKKIAKRRQRFSEMPMTIALVMAIEPKSKIPVQEQELSVGAGAMNVLNALHAEGFGGFWVSSDFADEPCFREALGLGDAQRLAGFLFVGTPDKPVQGAKRPDVSDYMAFWKSEPVSFGADK